MYSQKSTWGKGSIIITLFVCVLFIGMGIGFYFMDPEIGPITAWSLWVLLAVLCVVAMCFFPMEVRVDDKALSIVFSLRIKTIPLDQISHVSAYTFDKNFYRTCGSGGFFGFWGWFRSKQLGNVMFYTGNLKDLALVELTNGKKYIISCAHPQSMADAIMKAKNKIS